MATSAMPQGADGDPLEELRNTWALQRYLNALQERAVRSARAEGRSWADIARALGTTRQAAWQRWGAVCERDANETPAERAP